MAGLVIQSIPLQDRATRAPAPTCTQEPTVIKVFILYCAFLSGIHIQAERAEWSAIYKTYKGAKYMFPAGFEPTPRQSTTGKSAP